MIARPPPASRPRRWLAVLLPVAAFGLLAMTTPGLPRGDAAGVYLTAAALVEGGSFAIDGGIDALAARAQGAGASPGAYRHVAYAAGRYYHTAPPGPALLAAPLYALGLVLEPAWGPESPLLLLLLLGPLLGAVAVAGVVRAGWAGSWPLLLPGAAAALIVAWPHGPGGPGLAAAAALAAWVVPGGLALWRGEGTARRGFAVGLGLGAFGLVAYAFGAVTLLAVPALVLRRWRRPGLGLALLAGAALPVLALAAWQDRLFGAYWHPAFMLAVDPAARGGRAYLREAAGGLGWLVLGLGFFWGWARLGTFAWPARRVALPALLLLAEAAGLVALFLVGTGRREPLWPVDWWTPATAAPVAAVAVALALALLTGDRWRALRRPRAALAAALVAQLAAGALAPPSRGAVAAGSETDYAAPFAAETPSGLREVWGIERGKGTLTVASLRLDPGAVAVSPWVVAWPGLAYEVAVASDEAVYLSFGWEDEARAPVAVHATTIRAGGERRVRFAAPPGAAGLRLRIEAFASPATVGEVHLALAGGARVEPFPDARRAALAFSFDWESAMGGLIHSRSAGGEGVGATTGLRADGGPAVAEAEAKALRMREGAQYLSDLFARYGITATFYATGYNLLDGNPACQTFVGDPVYRNVNVANGWGSDWWRTHPWYGDDPCQTEAQAPAWYFAGETRALAAAGHEIASHTFGHLYVRGVTPEQLAADLDQWRKSAAALGLPPAQSFAFPWTSSNSLDAPFFAVFAREGLTVLTRIYPLDLHHPLELARLKADPALLVFPDLYLPSTAKGQGDALAQIDLAIAARGYTSLWTHPNEALEQGGQVIWPRVVDYAAAQRNEGLWIAPVSEIAGYGAATREVAVTALPLAGGARLTVENRSGRSLDGLTLSLPGGARSATINGRALTIGRDGQVVLPTLVRGAQTVVLVRR